MDFLDFILHFDEHLGLILQEYGMAAYFILFAIIFCETGLVVTPFLPGDTLIFVAATFAARGSLNIGVLWLILSVASVLGDSLNYSVGSLLGKRVLRAGASGKPPLIKPEYLEKTERFYAKYGRKTIIIARFIPIVRTFAPFVAGTARMDYSVFLTFNIVGGLLWVSLFSFSGYFFGGLPWVQENLHYIVLVIIVLSFVPPFFEYWKARRKAS